MSIKTPNKNDIRRIEILEHFQIVLKEEGFEGASIAKIAKKVGVHPSLLIHYFSSKEEMISELVEFTMEKYEKLVLEKTKEAVEPEDRLNSVLDLLFGFDWVNQVHTSAYYSCYSLSLRNEKVHERMERMYSRFRSELSILLKQCMDLRIIYRDNPDLLADFIICNIEGATFYRNIAGRTDQYSELCEFMKEKIRNLLFRNVGRVTESSMADIRRIKNDSLELAEDLIRSSEEIKKVLSDM